MTDFTSEELLAMTERALERLDWGQVHALASDVLALEPDNTEAAMLRAMADRHGGRSSLPGRRQATALVVDLVESTPLAERYDVEVYGSVLRAFELACRPVIERHEGQLVDVQGDAIVACFGYPSGHEDDASRAVSAALDMLAALGPVAARLQAELGVELHARIGIDTGIVVIDGVGVLGPALNRAARLQALAALDTVVISATTNELVAGRFDTEPLGPRKLKGVDAPVEVHRVIGRRDPAGPARVPRSTSLPFIGRDAELQRVLDLWDRAPAAQRNGEAGKALSQRVSDEFVHMLTRTIEGQAIELGWRADNVVDLEPIDYLTLIGQKTCWYTTVWPLRVGALIGSVGTASLDAMTRFGFYLGAAFQIRDDLLNLIGVEADYGKELLGDIREGKRTLMLIHLLGRASVQERKSLVAFLARAGKHPDVPDDSAPDPDIDAESILELMVHYGSLEFAFQFGQGVATAAYESFHDAFADVPPSASRGFVEALIPYMLARVS